MPELDEAQNPVRRVPIIGGLDEPPAPGEEILPVPSGLQVLAGPAGPGSDAGRERERLLYGLLTGFLPALASPVSPERVAINPPAKVAMQLLPAFAWGLLAHSMAPENVRQVMPEALASSGFLTAAGIAQHLSPWLRSWSFRHPILWGALTGAGSTGAAAAASQLHRPALPGAPAEEELPAHVGWENLAAGAAAGGLAGGGAHFIGRMVEKLPAVANVKFRRVLERSGYDPEKASQHLEKAISRISAVQAELNRETRRYIESANLRSTVEEAIAQAFPEAPADLKVSVADNVMRHATDYIRARTVQEQVDLPWMAQMRRPAADIIDQMSDRVFQTISSGEKAAAAYEVLREIDHAREKFGEDVVDAVRYGIFRRIVAKIAASKAGGLESKDIAGIHDMPPEMWSFLAGNSERGEMLKKALEGLVRAEKAFEKEGLRLIFTPTGLVIAATTLGTVLANPADLRTAGFAIGGVAVTVITIPRLLKMLTDNANWLARLLEATPDYTRRLVPVLQTKFAEILAEDIAAGRALRINLQNEFVNQVLFEGKTGQEALDKYTGPR